MVCNFDYIGTNRKLYTNTELKQFDLNELIIMHYGSREGARCGHNLPTNFEISKFGTFLDFPENTLIVGRGNFLYV